MMMSPDHYYGIMEQLRSASERFYLSTSYNYFSVLVQIHEAFGLSAYLGKAVAIATLVSKK